MERPVIVKCFDLAVTYFTTENVSFGIEVVVKGYSWPVYNLVG